MGRGACLAVSSRLLGQRQRRPDGRTCSCCSGEQLDGGWRIVVDCERQHSRPGCSSHRGTGEIVPSSVAATQPCRTSSGHLGEWRTKTCFGPMIKDSHAYGWGLVVNNTPSVFEICAQWGHRHLHFLTRFSETWVRCLLSHATSSRSLNSAIYCRVVLLFMVTTAG